MRVIQIGYSGFNADVLEGLTQDEIYDMFPNIRESIIKELCVQLKAPKKAKKVVKPRSDSTED